MAETGFLHFLVQADAVALGVLVALLAMSILSWSLIVLKGWRVWREGARRRAFLDACRDCPTPAALERRLAREAADHAARRLASAEFAALRRWRRRVADAPLAAAPCDEFVDRALHRALLAERARQEAGMTALAAVSSTAPFVGLFGTVWGIHHALLAIGASGQATIDQVAGPVGEALAMTAIGLAVAIPATLAYNAFVRVERNALADLEDFAHELHALLATGVPGEAAPDAHVAPLAGRALPEAA